MTDSDKPWESRWTIIEKLDSAGDGRTALVEQRSSGVKGVLKYLQSGPNRYTRANMAREIVNLSDLFNAGCSVPRVLDKNTNAYSAKDGALYFVREFAEGRSLHGLITEGGPWSGGQVNELLESLVRSLKIAFALNIVHGDLRPDNIVMVESTPPGFAILNYGITFDRSARSILTPKQGTARARFLDLPEIVLDGREPDQRSDITGLIALAFYALTGEAPRTLVGDGGLAPHQRDPEALARCFADPKHHVAADAFFEQGFARQPDDRFQTLDEFLSCWRRVVPLPPMSAQSLGLKP